MNPTIRLVKQEQLEEIINTLDFYALPRVEIDHNSCWQENGVIYAKALSISRPVKKNDRVAVVMFERGENQLAIGTMEDEVDLSISWETFMPESKRYVDTFKTINKMGMFKNEYS